MIDRATNTGPAGLTDCDLIPEGEDEDEIYDEEEEYVDLYPYEDPIPELRYWLSKYLFALLLKTVLYVDIIYMNIELPKTYEYHMLP